MNANEIRKLCATNPKIIMTYLKELESLQEDYCTMLCDLEEAGTSLMVLNLIGKHLGEVNDLIDLCDQAMSEAHPI